MPGKVGRGEREVATQLGVQARRLRCPSPFDLGKQPLLR